MDFIKKIFLAKQKITQKGLRLKLRTTLFTSMAVVLFFATFTAVVYYSGYNLLLDKAVESQGEMARTLASATEAAIEKQAELLRINANSQFIIDALKENNLKYGTKSVKETQRYLMDMDKRWVEAPDDYPLLKDYLENKLSLKLKELKAQDDKLINIQVTDRFGGLAGSTTRPSGFYSFDQDWWSGSFANGMGKLFIGAVEYDEQSSLWYLPFAVPIKDEAGLVVGIYKALISIDMVFKPLVNFKIGNTGNAVLADDKAYLIYHYKSLPFTNKFCAYEEFQRTLQNDEKWGILDSAYLNHGKTLAAFSEINIPILSAQGMNWFVFVERDLSEILLPLNKLIFVMLLAGLALTIILALFVFIISGQESPNSILQVINETAEVKGEDKDHSRNEESLWRLPEEKEHS